MADHPDQRYPLTWPPGWPRTPRHLRAPSPFKPQTTDRAFRELVDELGRLGARKIIISSNLKLRQDGMPYSQQPRHDDEGIAVYFVRKSVEMVLACDKYVRREENLRAITKTIDAIRGLERWGSSDMMERAFTGFTALPSPVALSWRDVLDPADPLGSYRRLRSQAHPDRGGSDAEFAKVEAAWAAYQKETGAHG
ncbi:J domain-containing protein [Luteimonas fraxinea]|uniref:J domain-containing protein n=1 Tax=Luteimonas fraxinea TaxID=2901869 RepID=A0ABS8UBP1_9GAMM|nr:J domain-containing protein [Luteimonas fraxinea]MCD9096146.1 J domain-containing protein [Luteimonas fraxinea]